MKLEELDFAYPERLVATERARQSRIMLVRGSALPPRELNSIDDLLELFRPGDVLVVNDTRVLKRRVFAESGLEILFLSADAQALEWDVLCPVSRWRGEEQILPGGLRLRLLARGRPQRVRASRPLDASYFAEHGEMPLPPYIQKARGERHNRATDADAYQAAWAERDGSLAAPTASLHFSMGDLSKLRGRGVAVERVTLHVGLGTFLPVTAPDLRDHVMHFEKVEVSAACWRAAQAARARQNRVWALGTTVARALESAAHGRIPEPGGFFGATDLFIQPGFEYKAVDALLTNFHQPKSTLLALVAAFAPGGLAQAKSAYAWAIEREFRLFIYGDLSAWIK